MNMSMLECFFSTTNVFNVYSDIIDNEKTIDKDKVFLEQVNIDMPD